MGGRGAMSSQSSQRKFDGKKQLQGIGKVDALKAGNLKKGDIMQWNYGSTSKVVKVEPTKSGKSVVVTERSSTNGKEYTRTFRKDRLVAISSYETNK